MSKMHRDVKVGDWVQVAWDWADSLGDPCLVLAIPDENDPGPVVYQVLSFVEGKPEVFYALAKAIVGHGPQVEPPSPQQFRTLI